MNDTPSTPEDDLEEDLELTAEEGDDVAGGAEVKYSYAKGAPTPTSTSTTTQKVTPTITSADGSV